MIGILNIAILGFGNIGSGVAEVLERNRTKIAEALGENVAIRYILDKRDLSDTIYGDRAVRDFDVILKDPEVSVVCEMLGGTQPAFDYSMAALRAGKSVVTSNKEVVARFGDLLLAAAKENGVRYLFEASVGGGIPLLHAFDDSLRGCVISRIDGILNGTTNYILTRMHDCASGFEDALQEARRLGYAEANPSADISGADAFRKICILAAMAWGGLVSGDAACCEGISAVTQEHNAFASRCGGTVKLVATAAREEELLSLSVSPCVVMDDNPLSAASGVFNAVKIAAGDLGDVMFYGMGAGKYPTASAVISDILAAAEKKASERPRLFTAYPYPLVDPAEWRTDYCLSVRCHRDALGERLPAYCVLHEADGVLDLLCEDISKKTLLEAMAGIEVLMLMRAVV